jgi:hypothetical protein
MQEVETAPEVEVATGCAAPMAYGGVEGCRNERELRSYRIACERIADLKAGRTTSRPLEEIMCEFGELPDGELEDPI